MGMFSKIVLASAISFGSVSAFADTLVSCTSVKASAQVSLQYVIKGTESKRLNSDILFSKAGNFNIISTARVAQYVSTGILLHFVADDNAEQVALRFTAAPTSKTTWLGAIEEFGASTVKTAVKCTTSDI